MLVAQTVIQVAAVLETSQGLCSASRDTRRRSSEIRARSRRLRLRRPHRPVEVAVERRADVAVVADRVAGGNRRAAKFELIDVRCDTTASGTVVRVTGEIDMVTVRALASTMAPHLGGLVLGGSLAVDLSGVTFIDLHGITLLETVAEAAEAHGATFGVVGCSPRLRRLLLLTGTDSVLDLG